MKRATPGQSEIVLTVGHSTRPLPSFIKLLQSQHVACLVDVRTIPRSRHNPQFNEETLPAELRRAAIKYHHLPGLGGLRHARPDSINTAWRNASFRGFADYMQTPEFEEALQELTRLAARQRVAIMCAEAVPWRCHRSLIADALSIRGIPVEHILSGTHIQPHTLTPWAKVRGQRVTYPAQGEPASESPPKKAARKKTSAPKKAARKKAARKRSKRPAR